MLYWLLPFVSASEKCLRCYGLALLLALSLLAAHPVAAQNCFPTFLLRGDAVPAAGGCTRLTNQGDMNSWGAMWNAQTINLNFDFDFTFNISQCGAADGVVFVLQNDGPNVSTGSNGGSLGYYAGTSSAFSHSVGVELDFYRNTGSPFNDPPSPHMMLALNGNPAPVLGPVIVPGLADCNPHPLRIRWDHTARLLTVQHDGNTVFSYPQDLVANVFGGNPTVWFGFVGATGGSTAVQLVCPGTLTATAAPLGIVATGPTTLCPAERVALSVANQPAGATYSWSPAAGLNTTTGVAVVATPATSTTYRVTATTPAGCQTTDSVRLTVLPRPTVVLSPAQVLCAGASAPLIATSVEAGTTHTWAPATGLSATTGDLVTATPTATTLYTVTTTGPGFCIRHDTVRVAVRPPLRLALSAQPPTVPGGGTVLTASSAGAGVRYAWAPAAGLSATTGPVVTATPTVYTPYTVTATDAAGCTERATIPVLPLQLPNIITPNGDNLNDTFRPLVSLGPVTLQVFNRWGRLVFEQADYKDGWGAEGLAGGTYYFRLSTAAGESWKGWVEVVR